MVFHGKSRGIYPILVSPKNPWALHGRGRTRHLRRGSGAEPNPMCWFGPGFLGLENLSAPSALILIMVLTLEPLNDFRPPNSRRSHPLEVRRLGLSRPWARPLSRTARRRAGRRGTSGPSGERGRSGFAPRASERGWGGGPILGVGLFGDQTRRHQKMSLKKVACLVGKPYRKRRPNN